MRILYLTQWFEPEPNIIKGLRFVHALEEAGHDVTVVTGLPNYPSGNIYPGYRFRLIQHEVIDGVRITRLPLYPSHDASAARRSLNFLSFFVSALCHLLFRRRGYDMVYAYHPPITVGLAAALAGLVRRRPFVLDVQDLWPDTIPATGMADGNTIIDVLGRLCAFVYRRAAAIIVQSNGMRTALIERGVQTAKIDLIHNWAEAEWLPRTAQTACEPEAGAPLRIVYAGNLGRAQAMATVIDAGAVLQRRGSNVEILLYGDGLENAALHARAEAADLTLLRFMGRVPHEAIGPILLEADALLMHLRDEPLFQITIPSKTQFYLALGRPIIAGVAGEAATLLQESGAAIVVPPGDALALADAIDRFGTLDSGSRQAMGEAGRTYYGHAFAFRGGMNRTLSVVAGTQERRQ